MRRRWSLGFTRGPGTDPTDLASDATARGFEVTRLATTGAENGAANACSLLYSAAWRAARALGYRRILTYTQDGEHGASLRASGWQKLRDLPPRTGWHTPARPRQDRGTDRIGRTRWQAELRPPHPPAAHR